MAFANKMMALCLVASFGAFSLTSLAAEAPKLTKKECMMCHGSIQDLIKKNVQFPVDGGKVNPHRYIPHGEKTDDKFPECTVCHTPHAIPPQKGAKASATVDTCYECHHNYTFEPCKKCHK
jgi:predicted CXXCH cytochrome family protein